MTNFEGFLSNEQKLYIHGRYVDASSGQTFGVVNPATGEELTRVQTATEGDVEKAVASATQGQREWAAMPAADRKVILERAAGILTERNDELAELETLNTGKPFSETSAVDVVTGVDVLSYYAGLTTAIEGQQLPLRESSFFYTRREPLGVVAGIGAWNYPLQIALWKSSPALAAGNAMLFKPSEITPLTAMKLAQIYTEAGLPDGVFNVLHGPGSEVGPLLTEHPHIEKISFTGGIKTGKQVMASAAGSSLKDVTMELGGKSPLIILDDADMDQAADIAMMANFYSAGQVCTNGTRVFVPRARQGAFEQAIKKRVARIKMGDPMAPETNFGPMSSFGHMEKVLSYIESGKKAGARLVTGGGRVDDARFASGAYIKPTVFADCTDDMAIVRDEIFGPVMSILTYDDQEEAIHRANDTVYGLAAGIVTNNLTQAHRLIHRLQAGICWINTWGDSPAEMPVGGYKHSGVGRENGSDSLLNYTRTKSVQVEMAPFESVF